MDEKFEGKNGSKKANLVHTYAQMLARLEVDITVFVSIYLYACRLYVEHCTVPLVTVAILSNGQPLVSKVTNCAENVILTIGLVFLLSTLCSTVTSYDSACSR